MQGAISIGKALDPAVFLKPVDAVLTMLLQRPNVVGRDEIPSF